MPTFRGLPQSVLSKITTPDSQLALWTWAATGIQSDDTTDTLVASGFERAPINDEQPPYLCLASQGCDVLLISSHDSSNLERRKVKVDGQENAFVEVPSSKTELWARPADIQHVRHYPVILALQLVDPVNLGTMRQEEKTIPMLQFLPPAQIGSFGAVISQGDMHIHIHPLLNLPSEAQQLQERLHHALETLASPSDWYPWTSFVGIVAGDPFAEAFDAYAWLVNQPGSTSDKDKYVIEQMEVARKQIQQIQAAQAKLDWLTQWQEIQRMLKDLAAAYWTYHQELTKDEAKKRAIPTTPNVFSSGQALVSSTLTVQSVIAAQWDAASGAEGWERPEGHAPFFRHITSSGNSTIVEYAYDRNAIFDDKTSESFWKQVQSFNDRDVDVTMGLLAHLTINPDDIWFFASNMLDYRDVKPIMKKDTLSGRERRAGHRQEDIMDIAQSVERISNIWVTLDQHIEEKQDDTSKRKKKRKRVQHTLTSRFILIKEVYYQRELDTGTSSPSLAIGWRVQAGTWLQTFLESPNRHIAYLCQQALKYDPFRERWEKRLAYYFMFHIRMNAAGGGIFNREIGKLLNELSLDIDTRFPQRTRDHFEKAMNRLKKDMQIDDWQYVQDGKLPAKKWLETWLNWRVKIIVAPRTRPIAAAKSK